MVRRLEKRQYVWLAKINLIISDTVFDLLICVASGLLMLFYLCLILLLIIRIKEQKQEQEEIDNTEIAETVLKLPKKE